MEFDFYYDQFIGMTHLEKHKVNIDEIHDFFIRSQFHERRRKDGSFVAIAKLPSGRYLEVIYRKIHRKFFFIITAYDLEDEDKIDYINRSLEGL